MLEIATPRITPEPEAELGYVGLSVSQVGGALVPPRLPRREPWQTQVLSCFLALFQASRLRRLGGYWEE